MNPSCPENTPDLGAQQRFFEQAILMGRAARVDSTVSGVGTTKPIVTHVGPHFELFRATTQTATEELHTLDPMLTPEYIKPPLYRDPKVSRHIDTMEVKKAWAIRNVGSRLTERLRELGKTVLFEALDEQSVSPGILALPPVRRMGDEWGGVDRAKLCFNACFRMVFQAATGWRPDEVWHLVGL